MYESLGVRTIIKAAGPLTRLSGNPLHPEVASAMAEAAQQCVLIEDLQDAAGHYLAEVTGAEAGYVTAGAAAGLALGVAARLARLDPAIMDRLPDATDVPNEIVIQRPHLTAYSQALRLSGTRLVEVGHLGHPGQGTVWPWQIESAISERTVALAYSVSSVPGTVGLDEVVMIGRKHGVPVIVDAAAAVPPVENLRKFIAAGADLVTFSGGKAIGGPQASGMLVGRSDLIDSVALQHQDMDVIPETWSWRDRYLTTGRLPGPPHHGLGRPLKVGKEEIVGLVTALRQFVDADHEAIKADQRHRLTTILEAVNGLPGVEARFVSERQAPRPYVTATITLNEQRIGRSVDSVINELIQGTPPIAVSQNFLHERELGLIAGSFKPGEESIITSRLRDVLTTRA